jgi:hypothetical protein
MLRRFAGSRVHATDVVVKKSRLVTPRSAFPVPTVVLAFPGMASNGRAVRLVTPITVIAAQAASDVPAPASPRRFNAIPGERRQVRDAPCRTLYA